jgi:arginyl-tRNA synthetase
MTSIVDQLSGAVGAAFEAVNLPASLGAVFESDRPDLAPYQCNGAMAAAKQARKAPRAVAEEVVAQLKTMAPDLMVEIAGPGFLNITPPASVYAAQGEALASDARTGAREADQTAALMIDFGGPNVAKPMHVGHLRSSVIGDSLQRLMRFRGHDVTSDIHLGDWGLQMGHLVTELQDEQPDLVYYDADLRARIPTSRRSPSRIWRGSIRKPPPRPRKTLRAMTARARPRRSCRRAAPAIALCCAISSMCRSRR